MKLRQRQDQETLELERAIEAERVSIQQRHREELAAVRASHKQRRDALKDRVKRENLVEQQRQNDQMALGRLRKVFGLGEGVNAILARDLLDRRRADAARLLAKGGGAAADINRLTATLARLEDAAATASRIVERAKAAGAQAAAGPQTQSPQ
jgi:hypothetical protein